MPLAAAAAAPGYAVVIKLGLVYLPEALDQLHSLHKAYISSSCRAASTDLPDPLLPPVSIIHCSQDVFNAIYSIDTELLYRGSSWSSCLCSSEWRGPLFWIQYFILKLFFHFYPCEVHVFEIRFCFLVYEI